MRCSGAVGKKIPQAGSGLWSSLIALPAGESPTVLTPYINLSVKGHLHMPDPNLNGATIKTKITH